MSSHFSSFANVNRLKHSRRLDVVFNSFPLNRSWRGVTGLFFLTDEKTEDRDEKKSECHKKLGIKLKYLNLVHFFSCSIKSWQQHTALCSTLSSLS